jgi:hypothetical protein
VSVVLLLDLVKRGKGFEFALFERFLLIRALGCVDRLGCLVLHVLDQLVELVERLSDFNLERLLLLVPVVQMAIDFLSQGHKECH